MLFGFHSLLAPTPLGCYGFGTGAGSVLPDPAEANVVDVTLYMYISKKRNDIMHASGKDQWRESL